MSSANDRALEWLDENVPNYTSDQLKSLTILLKEQDKLTRHACADAVTDALHTGEDVVGACINARAV